MRGDAAPQTVFPEHAGRIELGRTLRPVPAGDSVQSVDAKLQPGAILAHHKRYEVKQLVGEGGMGWVYRAYDPVLARDVALKVMKADVPEMERRRFHQEAMFGARFCHPGMVRVYDLGLTDCGRVEWFAMEYLPGRDLEHVMERARTREATIPLRLVADMFRQMLGALQYSHDCGVVHRDVKPANMFLTRDPNTRFVTTKLLDFGVALELTHDSRREQLIVGDPRYMAPEQARLGLPIDVRADIYAAGMALFEAVAGRHPFEELIDGPISALLDAHRTEAPPPMSYHLRGAVPSSVACGLDVVFAKACAKNAEDRFSSARDMAMALLSVLSDT